MDFIHVHRPPAQPGGPMLLLLHGTGGNEHDLVPLADTLLPGAGVLSPRGQVLERGMPRFFRRLAEGVFDIDDLKQRAADLADFIVSASAQPYEAGVTAVPHALTRREMDEIREQFVASTRRADEAGFDWLELHCAHGYLLSAFISPLTNRREDEYGGTLANRLRFPLEVFGAMRAIWPQHKPMSVRISAHDWVEGGITPADAVQIAQAFKAAGADLIDCSSGQVSPEQKPVYGRMYQTPFADRIRNEVGIATMAVGAITEADHANSIIAAGRADLCAIARPHLADPAWTLHAAAQLSPQAAAHTDWPVQYWSGRDQMLREVSKQKQAAALASPAQTATKIAAIE